MPLIHPKVAQARSAVATAVQRGRPTEEPRRNLAAANLEAYVERVVASAPALTDEQIGRIVGLLRPASRGGDERKAPPKAVPRRRRCGVCELESTPSGLARHVKASGHGVARAGGAS